MLEQIPVRRRFFRPWLLAGCALIACAAALVLGRSPRTGPSSQGVAPQAAVPEESRREITGSDHAVLIACAIGSDRHETAAATEKSLPAIRASTTVWLNTPEQKAALDAIIAFLPHMNYTDVLRPGYFCPADFNRDNVIDATDQTLFLEAWSDISHPLAGWADLNDDGTLDALDVDEFVRRTGTSDCDPAATAERRLLVC